LYAKWTPVGSDLPVTSPASNSLPATFPALAATGPGQQSLALLVLGAFFVIGGVVLILFSRGIRPKIVARPYREMF
jgi:hypothetical protein